MREVAKPQAGSEKESTGARQFGQMINTLYDNLERLPGLGVLVKRFRQGLPPRWLFKRSIVEWTAQDRALMRQLPFSYRIFGMYCGFYFQVLPSAAHLLGGRYVLRFIATLQRRNGYATITIGNYTVCLDLTDPRFLLVVNELRRQTDTNLLSQFLKGGDTFVDVGANQGAYSIVAGALVGSRGHVVAIEPQPRLAKAIGRSLAASPVTRFVIHQVAVGRTNGEITLIVPLSYSGSAGLYRDFSGANGYREIVVPLRRFDDLVDWKNFSGDIFVKLDIEGAESDFLEGAAEMIADLQPTLLIEINPHTLKASNTKIEQLRNQLQALGYRAYFELHDLSETRPVEDLDLSHRNILLRGNKRRG